MLKQVIEFVNESYAGKSVEHFERTLWWLKELKHDADEPMLIAAYAHDLERAFRNESSFERFKNMELNDPRHLSDHQTRSADVIRDFLRGNGYDKRSIERVYNMVLHHEEGGDNESDLIKDADSISYLEINAPKHVKTFTGSLGKDKVKRKIDWMYERITSERAKQLAEPFYSKAAGMLEAV